MSGQPTAKINISIEIPLTGGEPVVRTCTDCGRAEATPASELGMVAATAGPPPAEGVPIVPLTIITPTSEALVKSIDGMSGVICARGVDLDHVGNAPSSVFAVIMDPGASPPPYPPNGATPADSISTDGHWEFNELGPARCGASGSLPANKLVVWLEFPSTGSKRDEVIFEGRCSDRTSCEEAHTAQQSSQLAQQAAPTFPAVVPPVWRIEPCEFFGPLVELFNGPRDLLMETGGCTKTLRWSCHDEELTVRLMLKDGVWSLSFEAHETVVKFLRPGEHWNPVGVNTMQDLSCSGLPPKVAVPASLIVTPASA